MELGIGTNKESRWTVSSGSKECFGCFTQLREHLLEPPVVSLAVGANSGRVHRRLDVPRSGGAKGRESEVSQCSVIDAHGRNVCTFGVAAKLLHHEITPRDGGRVQTTGFLEFCQMIKRTLPVLSRFLHTSSPKALRDWLNHAEAAGVDDGQISFRNFRASGAETPERCRSGSESPARRSLRAELRPALMLRWRRR